MSEYLYQRYPNDTEGQLTKKRAWIISDKTLLIFARILNLQAYVQRSSHMKANHQAYLSDAFEALLGALYLDQGKKNVKAFLFPLLDQYIRYDIDHDQTLGNYKSELQEKMQKDN